MSEAQQFKVVIDDEIRNLIPPSTQDELQLLEDSIKQDGVRDPIITWQETDILLDGHQRRAIARRLGIKYRLRQISLPSREAAMEWVLRNQLSRRNLSDYDRIKLLLRLKPELAKEAEARRVAALIQNQPAKQDTGTTGVPEAVHEAQGQTGRVIDIVAGMADVSAETVRKVEVIEAQGSPEIKEAAAKGEMSISKAHEVVTGKGKKTRKVKPGKAHRYALFGITSDVPATGTILMDAIQVVVDSKADTVYVSLNTCGLAGKALVLKSLNHLRSV